MGGRPVKGRRVLVLGADAAGFACADALLERGCEVWIVEAADDAAHHDRLKILETLGATHLRPDATLPGDLDLVVLPTAARLAPSLDGTRSRLDPAVAIWNENDVAWQLRPTEAPAPWIMVSGRRGTAALARLTAHILRAGGLDAVVAGGPADPVVEAVLHPRPPGIVVVDLGGRAQSSVAHVAPLASVWFQAGELASSDTVLARSCAAVYAGTRLACIYHVAEPASEEAVRDADVQDGCRAIGITLGVPAPSFLGVVDEILCDRAFVPNRSSTAAELCTMDDVSAACGDIAGPRVVTGVLSAAALSRAAGVAPGAVLAGLRAAAADLGRT